MNVKQGKKQIVKRKNEEVETTSNGKKFLP